LKTAVIFNSLSRLFSHQQNYVDNVSDTEDSTDVSICDIVRSLLMMHAAFRSTLCIFMSYFLAFFHLQEAWLHPGAARGSIMQCHCGRSRVTALPSLWQPYSLLSQPDSTATMVLAVVLFTAVEVF